MMFLSSPAFDHGGKIPSEYTCDGSNINPELRIGDIPSGTVSLILIMDDPDVPEFVRKDKMYVHWVIFNIPPDQTHIAKNSQPSGTPGMNTGGKLGYQGPCPPDREHRYFFKLYAIDSRLDLPRGATKVEVEKAMKKHHLLAQTELMGRYERTRSN
jgi:Raf kinase inhibitor-like YbhB/YbcL family protein